MMSITPKQIHALLHNYVTKIYQRLSKLEKLFNKMMP